MNSLRIYTTAQGDIGIDVAGSPRGGLTPTAANDLRRDLVVVLARVGLLDDIPNPVHFKDVVFDITLAGRVVLHSDGVHTKTIELFTSDANGGGNDTRAKSSVSK